MSSQMIYVTNAVIVKRNARPFGSTQRTMPNNIPGDIKNFKSLIKNLSIQLPLLSSPSFQYMLF